MVRLQEDSLLQLQLQFEVRVPNTFTLWLGRAESGQLYAFRGQGAQALAAAFAVPADGLACERLLNALLMSELHNRIYHMGYTARVKISLQCAGIHGGTGGPALLDDRMAPVFTIQPQNIDFHVFKYWKGVLEQLNGTVELARSLRYRVGPCVPGCPVEYSAEGRP